MDKENNVIFPMGDQYLDLGPFSENSMHRLYMHYEEHFLEYNVNWLLLKSMWNCTVETYGCRVSRGKVVLLHL